MLLPPSFFYSLSFVSAKFGGRVQPLWRGSIDIHQGVMLFQRALFRGVGSRPFQLQLAPRLVPKFVVNITDEILLWGSGRSLGCVRRRRCAVMGKSGRISNGWPSRPGLAWRYYDLRSEKYFLDELYFGLSFSFAFSFSFCLSLTAQLSLSELSSAQAFCLVSCVAAYISITWLLVSC